MESRVPRKGTGKNSPAVTAAAVFLLGVLPSAALAATGSVSQCDTEARDLMSLQINSSTLDNLTIRKVDHDSAESEWASLPATDAETGSDETSTPLLNLTPRVANMLRDIFRIQTDTDTAHGVDVLNLPSSPLAGSTDDVDQTVSGEEVAPLAGADEEILPGFQQQMYRKDI